MIQNDFVKVPLVDMAYNKLKEDVCLRKYAPGQRLIISDLSDSLGISQTPIKEALNRLVSEGLVEAIPRKGMQVRKFDKADMDEIFDVRLMCELFCIKKALKEIDENPILLQKFTKNIEKHEQIIDTAYFNDYNKHHELDEEFHMLIINSAQNRRILQLYTDQKSHLLTFYIYAQERLRRYRESLIEHKKIYEALLEKDEEKVTRSLENHILNVKNDIRKFS